MNIDGQWHRRFNKRGLRLTIPREAVIHALSTREEHLSAEDIYMAVHKKYPAIGLTTIYRTLDILIRMGVVLKFDFGDGRARYELTEAYSEKKHHHHLICTGCSKIIDYMDFLDEELEMIKKTEKALSKKYDFQITGHMMQFYGLCDVCKKQ
jgi:Fur family ferric uptake transcriptional regulator